MFHIGIDSERAFDETCCKLKAVPKECMGNCRNVDESFSSRVMGLPPSACDDYVKIIEECVVVRNRGIKIFSVQNG
jgi:hypothetical protein